MRIAQVAPPFVRIPPRCYGGTERIVQILTEELVQRGHHVTLFAAGGSVTSAELHATAPAPLWELNVNEPLAYRALQIEEVIERSGEFDLIHSHIDHLPWLAGNRILAPLVTTLHGRLDLKELQPLLHRNRGQMLVSISDSQRRPVHDLGLSWIATVHHGLPADLYRLGNGTGNYLVFLGRISPEKDPVTAIRIALRAGIPIKIAARIDPMHPIDFPYYEDEVRPLLDHPLIEWMGEIDDQAKDVLLGQARAMLVPLDWDEPFGLTFLEAMATGTPIISRPRGSLPEIMRHGEHGFLVESEDEMVEACQAVVHIDRAACRDWALREFSVERMVDGYELAYETVLTGAAREQVAEPAFRPSP
jgi:glycosyltransferase involved in cell wall biosynthesis